MPINRRLPKIYPGYWWIIIVALGMMILVWLYFEKKTHSSINIVQIMPDLSKYMIGLKERQLL